MTEATPATPDFACLIVSLDLCRLCNWGCGGPLVGFVRSSRDGFLRGAGCLQRFDESVRKSEGQLLGHCYGHQEAASHRRLKFRRSAPLEKIIGIWSSCCEGDVYHPSHVHDVEGSADECLLDIVGIADFNWTSGWLHCWHDTSPSTTDV